MCCRQACTGNNSILTHLPHWIECRGCGHLFCMCQLSSSWAWELPGRLMLIKWQWLMDLLMISCLPLWQRNQSRRPCQVKIKGLTAITSVNSSAVFYKFWCVFSLHHSLTICKVWWCGFPIGRRSVWRVPALCFSRLSTQPAEKTPPSIFTQVTPTYLHCSVLDNTINA